MGTHCRIFIKIEESEKGKWLKCNKNLLHNPIEWYNQTPKFKIKATTDYIGIYCHYDGYIDGVGKELLENYNTREKALNLISCGDCSEVLDNVRAYFPWRTNVAMDVNQLRRVWNVQRPYQSKVLDFRTHYVYLFENGEWYLVSKDYSKTLLKDLVVSE